MDGRLKEWGSGGRDAHAHKDRMAELQLREVKASQITQQTINTPLRTATVRYMANSYLNHQKKWNEDRKSLIKQVVEKGSKVS